MRKRLSRPSFRTSTMKTPQLAKGIRMLQSFSWWCCSIQLTVATQEVVRCTGTLSMMNGTWWSRIQNWWGCGCSCWTLKVEEKCIGGCVYRVRVELKRLVGPAFWSRTIIWRCRYKIFQSKFPRAHNQLKIGSIFVTLKWCPYKKVNFDVSKF